MNRQSLIKSSLLWMLAVSSMSLLDPATVSAQTELNPPQVIADMNAALENGAAIPETDPQPSQIFQQAFVDGDPQALVNLATQYAIPAISALAILFLAYVVSSMVARVVSRTVKRTVDETLATFCAKGVRLLIMLLAVLGVAGSFGIDVTSFAAVLAAAGFAIGMALQGTLSNFAAGVMLLVFRPYRVGDYIRVAGVEGAVNELELFTTAINTADNRHIVIPNSNIFGSTIENLTHNPLRRVDVAVGVAYNSSLQQTRQVLAGVAHHTTGVLPEPAPVVYLNELGSSSVDWQIRVWCKTSDYWAVRERVTEAVKRALDRDGISIPYPQLDLHVITPAVARRSAA